MAEAKKANGDGEGRDYRRCDDDVADGFVLYDSVLAVREYIVTVRLEQGLA